MDLVCASGNLGVYAPPEGELVIDLNDSTRLTRWLGVGSAAARRRICVAEGELVRSSVARGCEVLRSAIG